MSKFAIGDRVKILDGHLMGRTGTIIDVWDTSFWGHKHNVRLDPGLYNTFNVIRLEDELELLPAPNPPVPPSTAKHDDVQHPSHYNQVPGIECIDVVKHFNFCRGNAIKYIWRAGHKGDAVKDLRKAIQNLEFEIAQLESEES